MTPFCVFLIIAVAVEAFLALILWLKCQTASADRDEYFRELVDTRLQLDLERRQREKR